MPEATVIPLDGGSDGSRRRRSRSAAPKETPAEVEVVPTGEPSDLERKLAGALAFVRRRITGDFGVDDFGFDADLTEACGLTEQGFARLQKEIVQLRNSLVANTRGEG